VGVALGVTLALGDVTAAGAAFVALDPQAVSNAAPVTTAATEAAVHRARTHIGLTVGL